MKRRQYKDYLRCDLFTCLSSVTSVYLWMWITKVKIYFFFVAPYVSLVTTVSEAWTSESRGRAWLIGNIVLFQNKRTTLTRLRAHGAILQRDDNRHPWGALETPSQRWRCLEWCFQNSFKENRYFLYFVLLSLRRWSLNMCVLVRAHTTWAASINQADETIASTSQRLRSEENLNDKYSSM